MYAPVKFRYASSCAEQGMVTMTFPEMPGIEKKKYPGKTLSISNHPIDLLYHTRIAQNL